MVNKVVMLWFNFSTSTSYPNGPVSSGLSLYEAELLDKEIGESTPMCSCHALKSRKLNVGKRRDSYMKIEDIRSLTDNSSLVNLDVSRFYELLIETISELYPSNFNFEGRNMAMAIAIDEETTFSVLDVFSNLRLKLVTHYKLIAHINMAKIKTNPEDDIPFMNNDIDKFTSWLENVSNLNLNL